MQQATATTAAQIKAADTHAEQYSVGMDLVNYIQTLAFDVICCSSTDYPHGSLHYLQ
jgi:hypothetical protein